MKLKLLKLYVTYYFYLGFVRLANRALRLYYRLKGCHFDQMQIIHQNFMIVDDYLYAALITRYLIDNIDYDDSKKIDLIKDPEHFLFDGKGNCNDFSATVLRFLMKYKPYHAGHLMIVYADNWRGHAVCTLQRDNQWYHCSNWGVSLLQPSLEALAASIHPEWTYYALVDENLNLKKVVLR